MRPGLLHLLLIVIAIGSCSPKTKDKSSKANGVHSSLLCSANVSVTDIANPEPTKLALADLTTSSDALDVDGISLSKTLGNTSISADDSKLGRTPDVDLSNTFFMWRACPSAATSCSSAWTKAYSSLMSDLTDIPVGLNSIEFKICVSSKDFLVDADHASAQNQCDSSAPCYCGASVTTRYLNANDPANLDAHYKEAVHALNAEKQTMLSIAQDYVNQATDYIQSCQQKDANTLPFTYAKNIQKTAPAVIAQFSEAYASSLATLTQELKSSSQTGLYLADGSCSSAVSQDASTGTDGSTLGAQLPDTSYYTSDTEPQTFTDTHTNSSVATATQVEMISGFDVSPSTAAADKPKKIAEGVFLAIGIGGILGGIALIGNGINRSTAGIARISAWNTGRSMTSSMEKLWSLEKKALTATLSDKSPDKYVEAYEKEATKIGKKLNTLGINPLSILASSNDRMSVIKLRKGALDKAGLAAEIEVLEEKRAADIKAKKVSLQNTIDGLHSEARTKVKEGNKKSILGGVAVTAVSGFFSFMAGNALALSNDTCGHFMQTAQTMEAKLLSQQKAIQAAMQQVTDAQLSSLQH